MTVVPLSKADKTVKKKRSASAYRDARFMRDLEGFLAAQSTLLPARASVCNALDSITAPTSSMQEPHKGGETRATTPTPHLPSTIAVPSRSGAPGRVRSKFVPWWRGMYLNEPLRRHRVPARWRDTSDILRCHYAHEAILRLGPVHTFTVRLRDDREAKARAQSSPISWLQKRIDRELSNALNRPVQFILTVEEEKGRLHCHGEFQVNQVEVTAARAGLRKAGGAWKKARQHQTKTEPNPDDGWTGYISKGFWMTTPTMRRLMAPFRTKYRVTFRGSPLSVTADLNAQAKTLYEEHRALLID